MFLTVSGSGHSSSPDVDQMDGWFDEVGLFLKWSCSPEISAGFSKAFARLGNLFGKSMGYESRPCAAAHERVTGQRTRGLGAGGTCATWLSHSCSCPSVVR